MEWLIYLISIKNYSDLWGKNKMKIISINKKIINIL